MYCIWDSSLIIGQVSDERRSGKEDSELKAVLATSLAKVGPSIDNPGGPSHSEDYDNLQAAIKMSLQGTNHEMADTTTRPQVYSNGKNSYPFTCLLHMFLISFPYHWWLVS